MERFCAAPPEKNDAGAAMAAVGGRGVIWAVRSQFAALRRLGRRPTKPVGRWVGGTGVGALCVSRMGFYGGHGERRSPRDAAAYWRRRQDERNIE